MFCKKEYKKGVRTKILKSFNDKYNLDILIYYRLRLRLNYEYSAHNLIMSFKQKYTRIVLTKLTLFHNPTIQKETFCQY